MQTANQKKKSIRLTFFIIGTIAFSQGIMGLSDLAIQFMQKDDYHQEPAETAFITSLITIPWVIKPFWGILTDTVPIFGYRRKSYLLIFGLCGFFLWNALAHFGIQNEELGVALLMGINVCVAFCNVIGEALLVEMSGKANDEQNEEEQEVQNVQTTKEQLIKQQKKQTNQHNEASSNVSFFFGMRSFGTFITAYSSGALLQLLDKKYIFMITSLFPLQLAIISFFLEEKKYNKQDREAEKVKTSQTLSEFLDFVSKPAIYKPIMLIFAFMASPSVSTAMFYFYTNGLGFKPEFIGELRLMYSMASMAAVFFFNQVLKNIRFSKIFTYSTIFYCCVSYLSIILVTRKNVQYGIPDKLFCMGDGVLDQVVGELNTMPLLVLACKMCPKNIEATMYALLMSTINFGGMFAGQLGGVITYYMGVTDTDFTNLGLVIFFTSTASLLPLPFIGIIKEDEFERAKAEAQKKNITNEGLIKEAPDSKDDPENENLLSQNNEFCQEEI